MQAGGVGRSSLFLGGGVSPARPLQLAILQCVVVVLAPRVVMPPSQEEAGKTTLVTPEAVGITAP